MVQDFSHTNTFIILVSLVFLAIAAYLVFLAIYTAIGENKAIKSRLAQIPRDILDVDNLERPRALETFANHLTLPNDDKLSLIRYELSQAGFFSKAAIKYYYALRLLAIILPQLVILIFSPVLETLIGLQWLVLMACAMILVGFFLPDQYIRWVQRGRKTQAKNGFPDMMDLLVACVEAGLGTHAAFQRVADEIGLRHPALKANLDILNIELRSGRTMVVGMDKFAERVNIDEAKALAVILRQSEEMGSSLGKALRSFSDDMRNKRMMSAEEKAMALSAKLTVPLILFIFPAIMVMLLLPAGIRLASGLVF